MGGLRKQMPITFWTFIIGSLSLAGIFPLAGFWSKDEILLGAWQHNKALWAIAATVAFMTAFYMFRAIFLTFFGKYKGGEPVDHHDPDSHFHGDPAKPHESPLVMWLPLAILAVPAIGAGWFNINGSLGEFLQHALPNPAAEGSTFEWGIAISSSVLALAGIVTAWAIYYQQWVSSRSIAARFAPLATLFQNKFYMDRLYEDILVRTVLQGGWNRLLELNDKYVFDGAVNGSGLLARGISGRLRAIQNGQLQGYGLGFAAGVIVLVVAVFATHPL
jgi:NADH-quinone oxidoreductase subunit L